MKNRRLRGRPGVSEVVGALMLIIVVTAAVASLSYFLAAAQQQAQNRNAYLTSVHNDNLQDVYALFSPNDPTIQWELDGCGPITTSAGGSPYNGNWNVQQSLSSPGIVTLIPQVIAHTGALVSNGAATIQATLNGGLYNAISYGKQAQLTVAGPPYTYSLTLGVSPCTFNPASWNSITLAVRNTNTAASSLTGVQLNGIFRTTWYQVNQSGNAVATLGNNASLSMPARGTQNIMLNRTTFGSVPILKTDSLSVTLQSGSGNFFTRTFAPPTAVPRSGISTQNYQEITRDIVTLDGSPSYASNSSVQSYEWELDIPTQSSGCVSSAFSSPSNYDTAYVTGETIQFLPESEFGSHLGDCITGPIRATLIISDANGLTATSQPIIISTDSNIDPIGSISAINTTPTCTTTCTVKVTVLDIFGNPVNGAVVNAIALYGGVSVSPLSNTTDSAGQTTFTVTVTSSGSMDFDTDSLLPAQLAFP